MSAHTPGPWFIANDSDWQPWQDAVEINAVDAVICFTGGHDADRQKANARLIAAAPDLLACVEMALESSGYEHERKIFHAAIAKATGAA